MRRMTGAGLGVIGLLLVALPLAGQDEGPRDPSVWVNLGVGASSVAAGLAASG